MQTSNEQTWTASEIKELIEYVNYLKGENEDLQAKIVAMDAYVKNGDAKIRQMTNLLNQILYAKGN
jgi:erythromycin esterase-like protein